MEPGSTSSSASLASGLVVEKVVDFQDVPHECRMPLSAMMVYQPSSVCRMTEFVLYRRRNMTSRTRLVADFKLNDKIPRTAYLTSCAEIALRTFFVLHWVVTFRLYCTTARQVR